MDKKEKDPAFLFYSSDFLTGVSLMNYAQVGKYIIALSLQHQKGHLTFDDLNKICKNDSKVLAKFIKDEKGLYYNERLEKEITKRKKFVKSRQDNGKKGGRPPKNNEPCEVEQIEEKTDRFCLGFSSFSYSSFSSYENEIEDIDKKENNTVDIPYLEYIKIIVEFLNLTCKTRYRTTTKKTIELIIDKLNAGFTVEDFKAVIKNKADDWLNTEYSRYLRPSTLFGDKFEEYLNKPVAAYSTFETDDFFQAALERSNKLAQKRKEQKPCQNGNS